MSVARLGIWTPLSPAAHLRGRADNLPFPLEEPTCRLFSRARHALWHGVRALGLAPGDEVLVPAYHHGSEVETLGRARLVPRFYDQGTSLAPEASNLDSLLGARVKALYLIHYLGFPQDAQRWRAWCDERGLLLLEDAAQAWLASVDGRPAGSVGDLAVFCLYKTIGVPDGAALVVRTPASGPGEQPSMGLGGLAHRHALWAMQGSGVISALAWRTRCPGAYDREADFALGWPEAPPTAASSWLMARLPTARTAASRRAHYEYLLAELRDRVEPPFDRLPAEASPIAFPVETDDKPHLLNRLSAHGVEALDFWSTPHPSLPVGDFPPIARRRERTVCLPVHQELKPSELDRIVAAARPSKTARRSDLRLEAVESLESVSAGWTELAERTGNIFTTWEWTALWWRHFGSGRRLQLIACRSTGGRLVAVVPLYFFAVRPWRILRFIGHGTADQLGPVCAPEDRPAVARTLRRWLVELAPDLFIAERLAGDEGWPDMLDGTALSSEANPVIRFHGASWDGFLRSRSSNLRQQIRRFERKLEREHGLRYRLSVSPEDLSTDLETLFALHSSRWSDGSSAFTPAQDFHRDFSTLALERGWLRLWSLEADGRTVAAWYGFRFGGVESYYQAGRDPSWEGPPAGLVLLAHSIRSALEDGMREYRFLRGEEPFKYRFANDDPRLETVGVPRGRLGRMALTAGAGLPKRFASPLRGWLSR